MDHRGDLDPPGAPEQVFDRLQVVAVTGPRVLEAEAVEDRVGLHQLLHRLLEAPGRLVRLPAESRELLQSVRDLLLQPLVPGVDLELGQVPREPADGGGVGATVVVEDHDQVGRLEVCDLVQGLPGHAARERAVADDRHNVAGDAVAQTGLGDPQGVRQGGRGVAVLDQVVLALRAAGVAGQPTRLTEAVEGGGATGQQLVDVGLVSGVPDDRVARALEHPVHGQRELDDAEVGRKVAARLSDLFDEECSDLPRQLFELGTAEPADIRGGLDGLEH